jgi:xanthine dehydrogenase YagS FAD-binding subunit
LRPFEYVEARSIDEAVALLSANPGETCAIAGGTDLLSEIKEGVVTPSLLVSLAGIPELQGIHETADGLTIGALTPIADIADHPTIRTTYTALAEAAAGLATPQIRNVGTLGGNLNQRPRCWYYRHPLTVCLKKGGDQCYALAGNSKYLCVTGGERCYIVHPSDTAVALTTLDATIEVAGPSGIRSMSIEQFFISPGQDVTRENILGPGELVTRVHLPALTYPRPVVRQAHHERIELAAPAHPKLVEGQRRSLYLKAREREAGDFALVSVAAVVGLSNSTIHHAAVVLGGVAPVPYRARQVEEYLRGKAITAVDPVLAGTLALPDARPMADNGYKVVLAANLVKRAVSQLIGPPLPG